MSSKNNHNIKTAPIHPAQLTTGRIEDCAQCSMHGANGGDKNICKCSSCGICTGSFIRGALLELYDKHPQYPIVLIENVHCPGIESSPDFQSVVGKINSDSGFVPIDMDTLRDYYLERKEDGTIKTYYVYDLSSHYNLCSVGSCNKRRENDPEFKKGCVQCDLRAASDIMSGRADGLIKYDKKTIEGIETPVYAYCCKRNDCPLIELAFPVIINGICVAVIIIGQINQNPPDDWKRAMENRAQEMEDITKCADDFVKRMRERAELRETDYYYRLLSRIYDHLSKCHCDNDNISEIIETIYKEIADSFEYQQLTVLYSGKEQNSGFSLVQFPKGDPEIYSFLPEQLYEAVYTDDDGQRLHELFGTVGDNTVSFYRQHSHSTENGDTVDCFILTFVRWRQKESEIVGNFFDALNARLFSLLMTKLALEKHREADDQKLNQSILIETFSHDLNQKLEIVGSHTRLLDIKKYTWELPQNSRVFEDIKNYVKDINNLEMQLRHFTKEVRDNKSGFPTTKDVRNFFPYGQFLFNLAEYYDSQDIVRKLYMPTTASVTLNSSRYPIMRADPVLIERCVNNLLTNAFKYSYRYTKIYLDCYKEGQNYCIEVINYASPIKGDLRNRMFDFGISQSIMRSYKRPKGKGIGLASVKKICQLHEGSIQCLPDEIVSDYNVPVLYRLMSELSIANKAGMLKEKLASFKIDEGEYNSIVDEYKHLRNHPMSEEINYVASIVGARNLIEEICNYTSDYTEKLTGPYLRMALRTPTARVRFKIIIPQ